MCLTRWTYALLVELAGGGDRPGEGMYTYWDNLFPPLAESRLEGVTASLEQSPRRGVTFAEDDMVRKQPEPQRSPNSKLA